MTRLVASAKMEEMQNAPDKKTDMDKQRKTPSMKNGKVDRENGPLQTERLVVTLLQKKLARHRVSFTTHASTHVCIIAKKQPSKVI